MTKAFLLKPTSIVPVALWRFLFGLILVFECVGSNLVGYTELLFYQPPVAPFTFIGFEWLKPLPGSGMTVLYYVMGLIGLGIALGWRFRILMPLFTLLWWYVYLLHKVSYNNHHYLMGLLCIMMTFTPAHLAYSMDSKRTGTTVPEIPRIFHFQFVLLLIIVYTYAAIAKLYPDWIRGVLIEHWFKSRHSWPVLGAFYRWEHTKYLISWGGIAFDFLVIPAMLYKPTRNIAFVVGVLFHLTNSITFQIGTFPYMMIGSAVLFYPPEVLIKRFRLQSIKSNFTHPFNHRRVLLVGFYLFFGVQTLLPLRHHLFEGNVVWTEEGHRLSWRMMLRTKTGHVDFTLIKDGQRINHQTSEDLSSNQKSMLASHPDVLWQYCQRLKKKYGNEIEIYVYSRVSLNYRPAMNLVDPSYDMAKAEWHPFKHSEWLTAGPVP